jgi:exopolysaccharide biosynthesis polyprenyl glycosylphosphotransferase
MTRLPNKDHRVLLIVEEGAEDIAQEFRDSYKDRLHSLAFYNLNGRYGVFTENGELKEKPLRSHNSVEGIVTVIRETNSNEVFITAPLPYHTLVDTMLNFRRNGIKFMFSPKAYVRCTGRIGRSSGWITPAVDLSTGNLSPFYRMAKRCMDTIASTLALIAFLPLFIIIPILIKLTSRGPVFYTQMRCGHNGQPFKIYKFRSMVADAEKILQEIMDFDKLTEPVFKFYDDPRVTFIGNILRKTSIDELPQLFNVLKGDLSLVGPRPEEIALVKRYEPFLRERLKVKPGITGLQQITCRGSNSMKERMKYDLTYIKNQSLLLDVKILLKTVRVVALQKRAT